MADVERNKGNIVAFYDLMFNQCRPLDDIEQYAGSTYVQDNPGVADGKDGFIAYFEEAAREYRSRKPIPAWIGRAAFERTAVGCCIADSECNRGRLHIQPA